MQFVLKEIDVFVRIIELGGFKAAARDMNLTQSALTQRLKKLEALLGVKLIERTTRSVAPTAIGLSFLPTAKRMIAQFDQSMEDFQDVVHARSGRITIASLISVATYVLPETLRGFGVAHPNVSVRILDDSEQEIAEYVRRGEAEFAIDMRTTAPDSDLVVTPIMEDRFVLACRADHPLAKGGAVEWDSLMDMPLIMLGPRSGTNRLLLSRHAGVGRSAKWRYEVQHLSTMIGFVEAGLGVGIAPRMAMRAAAGGGLVQRALVAPNFGRTVVLVERRGTALSPAAERLKTMVLRDFKAFSEAV
ncbi:MAG: DNA-binding transcriptional LysR family regulator [Alphaproteobacteria bacterium]